MRPFLALVWVGVLGGGLIAQQPLKFTWKKGDELVYAVGQNTTVEELTPDEKAKKPKAVKTVTALKSRKKWTVTEVDAEGAATLELSIVSMKQDVTQTVDDGKPKVNRLDSADPDDAKAMPFLGKAFLTAKIDARGKLLDAKSDAKAAIDRLQVELPFRLVLPEKAPAKDEKWDRQFEIKLPPPLGTGEKFPASQTFTFRGMKDDYAVFGFATKLKEDPTDPALWPGIVPTLWEGDLFFNTKTGQYHGAKLTAKRDVPNHQGDGTKFGYTSEYTEALEGK